MYCSLSVHINALTNSADQPDHQLDVRFERLHQKYSTKIKLQKDMYH